MIQIMKIFQKLILLALIPVIGFCAEDKPLHVYPPVPGLEPSEHYSFKIRKQGSNEWMDMFALVTTCKSGGITNGVTADAYYWRLGKWSNTYVNFEISKNTPV